jgi:hypothetical protein
MRIPFPERVNLTNAFIFATILAVVQLFEGTRPLYSACVFGCIMVASFAFNVSGGIMYPSGAFVFFNTFFTILLPAVAKAVLREPADSNLRVPMRTIEVYLVGMVAMLVAVAFSRHFRARKAFIAGKLPERNLHSAYVGCAVLSVLLTAYLTFFPNSGNGSLSSFLVQVDRFPMLTLVLGVIYTVHRTNGRRSVSGPVLAMMLLMSLNGLISFSKEAFLGPFFAWAVTVALLRYRLHWLNIASFCIGLYFVIVFMVPYAQYGRNLQNTGLSQVQLSAYLLTHMDEVREGYNDNSEFVGNVHYYNERLGLLDRLDMAAGDDALIDVADREGAFGYLPLKVGFINLIPHVLYPDKPNQNPGNVYAHQIGILADDDNTTGVSFSPSADAYRQGLGVGLAVVEPLVLMLIFIVLDSVIGDVRANPVGLLTTIVVSRAASEASLSGAPLLIGQSLFTNLLAVYVCLYVLPLLGRIFSKQALVPAIAPEPVLE